MITTITPGITAKKINKLFANGGDFLFKKGTYTLDKILTVHSNTSVVCEEGVIFERSHGGRILVTYVNKDTTGYNGVHGVSWAGGTFKADTNDSAGIVIAICHARVIAIHGVTIEGCVDLHSIEINSSKNVNIDGCKIKNQSFKIGEEHKEAIQIDYAYKGGLSIKGATADSPCYDDTHCDDIRIIGCVFTNVPNGIGTHVVSESEEYHTNLLIEKCTFEKVKGNSVRLLGMKNVNIINCDSPAIIFVDTSTKAHTNHGKVKIPTRYNKNVLIKNCEGVEIKVE